MTAIAAMLTVVPLGNHALAQCGTWQALGSGVNNYVTALTVL